MNFAFWIFTVLNAKQMYDIAQLKKECAQMEVVIKELKWKYILFCWLNTGRKL